MSQRAIEAAMADLILGPPVDPDDTEALNRLLERHGVEDADRAYLLGADRSRLLVYRELVSNTLWSAVEVACPRTVRRLDDLFDMAFAAFLADRGPRTHYLRDVTTEFLDWVEPRWASDPTIPAYLPQLARFESLQIEVAATPTTSRDHAGEEALQPDRGLVFSEACRLVRYDFALHELPEDEDDRSEPVRRPTSLLAYRSTAYRVRFLELTPVAGTLIERLMAGASLQQGLVEAAATHEVQLDQSLLEGTARLLSDLSERGVILGVAES